METEDFPTARLKDLSEHIWHGRAWVNARDADVAFDAAHNAADESIDGDVLIWSDWMSNTLFEITVASTTSSGIKRVLESIKVSVRNPNLSVACVRSGRMIEHHDWRPFEMLGSRAFK